MPNPFRTLKKDEPMNDPVAVDEPKPSLWERFDAAERERRIQEFIDCDAELLRQEWLRLPPIVSRPSLCPRCGQGREKHAISTAEDASLECEITVHENMAGEVELGWFPYAYSYNYGIWPYHTPKEPSLTFRRVVPMRLKVTCECGKEIGSYRPLPEEQSHA